MSDISEEGSNIDSHRANSVIRSDLQLIPGRNISHSINLKETLPQAPWKGKEYVLPGDIKP